MSETPEADASGPKLTVGDTPSEALIKNAIQPADIPLPDGRTLHVRKPGVLAQFQITEAAGPELGMNSAWMQMVNPLVFVGGITQGGERRAVPMPQNKLQIESLIEELGEEGMDALLVWYGVNIITPMMNTMQDAEAAARTKAALKNL